MHGIYVHLPFCRVHCTYCPFAISTDLTQQDAYADALIREIELRGRGQAATSIYFGGGTPSRTSIENLRRITSAIRSNFAVEPGAEFSMEANPEDITPESLAAWRDLGVNRLSIGVQSFADAELAAIGRIHDSATARAAVALAVASGVRTSLDLIAGLPQQTPPSFEATLQQALDLGAGHLSLYMLDLDETTPLQVQVARGRTAVPEDELVASIYLDAVARLETAGLAQYEISNFARAGEECAHNLLYWTRREYHGFGIGAHSFAAEQRFANTRNIRDYIAAPDEARTFLEELGEDERRRETIFLSLRQSTGLDYGKLEELCGQEGVAWVDRGLREGWLRRSGASVAFTPAGFILSSEYISQLF